MELPGDLGNLHHHFSLFPSWLLQVAHFFHDLKDYSPKYPALATLYRLERFLKD